MTVEFPTTASTGRTPNHVFTHAFADLLPHNLPDKGDSQVTPTQVNAASSGHASLRDLVQSKNVKNHLKTMTVVEKWGGVGLPGTVISQEAVNAKISELSHNSDPAYAIEMKKKHVKVPLGPPPHALKIEVACRLALETAPENRSRLQIQAIRSWLHMTPIHDIKELEKFSDNDFDLLVKHMNIFECSPNEVLYTQGEAAAAFYLVFTGIVQLRVRHNVETGTLQVAKGQVEKLGLFAERAMIDNVPHQETAIAKTYSELIRVSQDSYTHVITQSEACKVEQTLALGSNLAQKGSAVVIRSYRFHMDVLKKEKSLRTKADVESLTPYLQTLRFFRPLPISFVREICFIVELVTMQADVTVFAEGDAGDLFYIILHGSVDVIVNSQDSRGQQQQTKLINLVEGSHFGELALMKGHGVRSATVLTREECVLLTISEKDYNATLRRLQNEDLLHRVHILQRIPLFQNPAWTKELLTELSYVLSEQQFGVGKVLYREQENAQCIYFTVRGEVILEKDIVDPYTQKRHKRTVDRLGPYQMLGQDAAFGGTFNQKVLRQCTATTTTPLKVLMLSRYDVFHRLSRSAMEQLRGTELDCMMDIVYVDRLYKSLKWQDYKSKTVQYQVERTNVLKSSHDNTKKVVTHVQKAPMLDCNDLLLLSKKDVSRHERKRSNSPRYTLNHHISRFNADSDCDSYFREQRLLLALKTERREKVAILNEGNPLVYMPDAEQDNLLHTLTRDNYIFSQPKESHFSKGTTKSMNANENIQKNQAATTRSRNTEKSIVQQEYSTSARRKKPTQIIQEDVERCRTEHLSPTPNVLEYAVSFRSNTDVGAHASFLIIGQVSAADSATLSSDAMHYRIQQNRIAVVPSLTISSKLATKTVQGNLYRRFMQARPKHEVDASVASFEFAEGSENADRNPQMSSFEPLLTRNKAQLSVTTTVADSCLSNKVRSFAVISLAPSRDDVPTSASKVRWMCVHDIVNNDTSMLTAAFSTGAKRFPGTLLCLVPTQTWVSWDQVYDYCIQAEVTPRMSTKQTQPSAIIGQRHSAVHGVVVKANHAKKPMQKTRSLTQSKLSNLASAISSRKPQWQVDKANAKQLHSIICTRMGLKSDENMENTSHGFTPKNHALLSQKLDSLRDYLDSRRPTSKSRSAYSFISLHRMQQFGTILKARIAKVIPEENETTDEMM